MATQLEIEAIADIILDKFGGDAALFTAWLHRANLQTELDALRSLKANGRADFQAQSDAFNAALAANQALQAAKEAEINAL